MEVSLARATAWVETALCDDAHRSGSVIAAVRDWPHGWLFVCLPPGQESSTNSPYIVDRRDGAVYTASSVIGSAKAIEVIIGGPEAVATSRRVFRVGVVGQSLDSDSGAAADGCA